MSATVHDSFVSKNLTACRMLQISIAQRQMEAKIHSFPAMYILGGEGGRCGQNGSNQGFCLGLKTYISAEQNLDLLTLAGSGTPKFWSVADTIPQKFGEFRSIWAMGMSDSFKIVPTQASYIFTTSNPYTLSKYKKSRHAGQPANMSFLSSHRWARAILPDPTRTASWKVTKIKNKLTKLGRCDRCWIAKLLILLEE